MMLGICTYAVFFPKFCIACFSRSKSWVSFHHEFVEGRHVGRRADLEGTTRVSRILRGKQCVDYLILCPPQKVSPPDNIC